MLRIDLPRRIERAVAPPESEPASPAPDAVSPGGEPAPTPGPERDVWPWLLGGGVGLLVVRVPAARAAAALMPRLRRTSPDEPGWTRRRAGAGFVYLDENGDRLSDSRTPSGARTW